MYRLLCFYYLSTNGNFRKGIQAKWHIIEDQLKEEQVMLKVRQVTNTVRKITSQLAMVLNKLANTYFFFMKTQKIPKDLREEIVFKSSRSKSIVLSLCLTESKRCE